jgi:integral membrane protein (TIGR01906 family)
MVRARWRAAALFLIALPLLLLLSNVRIAAGEPAVFGYSFDRYDAVETTGVARPELDRAARDIVRYFGDDRELLDIRVAIDGREQALFNPREVLHMRDVKDLFGAVFRLHELALIYVVGYIAAVFLWARERSMRHLARLVALGGGITVGALLLASGGVLIGFDDLFRQFHVLSFSNDFWQLDPDRDRLIQMFPRGFWFDATLGVGLLTMLEAALLSAVGFGYLAYLDRQRRRSAAPERLPPSPTALDDERSARPGGLPPSPPPLDASAAAGGDEG